MYVKQKYKKKKSHRHITSTLKMYPREINGLKDHKDAERCEEQPKQLDSSFCPNYPGRNSGLFLENTWG